MLDRKVSIMTYWLKQRAHNQIMVKFVASILLTSLYEFCSSALAQLLQRRYNLRVVIIEVGN